MIRRIPLVLLIPEDCIDEVREFFERKRSGNVDFHVQVGDIMGQSIRSVKRGDSEEKKTARVR